MAKLIPELTASASGLVKFNVDDNLASLEFSDEFAALIEQGISPFKIPGEDLAEGVVASESISDTIPINILIVNEKETITASLTLKIEHDDGTPFVPGTPAPAAVDTVETVLAAPVPTEGEGMAPDPAEQMHDGVGGGAVATEPVETPEV
jgi:hypothetical protein